MGTRQFAARSPGATALALALFVAMTAVVTVASVAYACTARASLENIQPSSAAPGEMVTVTGDNFHDGDVELTWNRSDGKHLATAQGPDFNADVVVPEDADSGPNYIMGTAYNDEGEVVGRDSIAFDVEGEESPDGSDAPGDPSQDEQNENNTQGDQNENTQDEQNDASASDSDAPTSSASASGGSNASAEPDDSTSQESSQPSSQEYSSPESPSRSNPESDPESNSEPDSESEPASGSEPDPARDSQSEPAPQPSSQPDSDAPVSPSSGEQDPSQPAPSADETDRSQPELEREPAANGSTASSEAQTVDADETPTGRLGVRGQPDTPDTETSAPSGTISSDLWDGVESDGDTAPGLQESGGEPSGELVGSGGQLAMAVGLIGAGLVLLMGGALVALMRRRPTAATRSTGA